MMQPNQPPMMPQQMSMMQPNQPPLMGMGAQQTAPQPAPVQVSYTCIYRFLKFCHHPALSLCLSRWVSRMASATSKQFQQPQNQR
jgi:hypothetical protein